MAVDLLSLTIGAVVAVGLAVLIYTQRNRINAFRSSAQQQVSTTRQRLTRGLDTRYRDSIMEAVNSLHVAGHIIPLEQIAVLPSFYTFPPPYNPLQEEPEGYDGPYNMLPLIPEWPQAIAPYEIPSIPLDRVLRGESNLALLGLPGSGRTVTLALITILTARQLRDDQEGALLSRARLPIYLHLANLNLSPEILGEDIDPLIPMLEAARSQLSGLLVGSALGAIRRQFAAGQGLILVDGWDEIPLLERQQAAEWLRVLIDTYPDNKYVVAGPALGYGTLLDLGLAPTFIRPWGNTEFAELGRLWTEAWSEIGGIKRSPAPKPEPEVVRRAVRGNRGSSPLDATLRIWATFAGDDPIQGRRGWYSAFVNRVIPAPELRGGLESIAKACLSSPETTGIPTEDAIRLVDEARNALDRRPSISAPDFIYEVTGKTRILAEYSGYRLIFTQPVIGAYLAAEGLRDEPFQESLVGDNPMNALVMPFLAQMQDITPYVERSLQEPNTVLREKLLQMASWAAHADPNAAWRGDFFKRLAQIMLSPAEFLVVREQVMAALVASRDRNVGFIFRQGLQSDNPVVRIISAFGLGGLGDPETVIQLGEALNDENLAVQAASALALGAIGTQPAVNYMLQALLQSGEMARRAVGEMLANNTAGEGHEILKEAIQEEDPLARVAAAYGLGRIIREQWAFDILDEAERRDSQWRVRAIATNMLDTVRNPPDESPHPHPHPEKIPWFVQWLEERGETVLSGPQGVSQLIRVMQEGDERTRLAAVEAAGILGLADGATSLYNTLRDEHPEVREAAYRSLGTISRIRGHPLPAVT